MEIRTFEAKLFLPQPLYKNFTRNSLKEVHHLSYTIRKIHARDILDSRGNPTVECQLWTDKGSVIASVPSGKSIGKYEAIELRDGKKRYHGKGVLKAVENVNRIIAPRLLGKDCRKQATIDQIMIELDGTYNKSKLGANAILAVSMAVCKAGALAQEKQLYAHIEIGRAHV